MIKRPRYISQRRGYLLVTMTWLIFCVIGAIPYMLSGTFDNFIDGLFESASGFTTTGATVIDDLESVPDAVLFWRALTHWIGGMGIVVLFAALAPVLGISGQNIAYAETPGPSKGKLTAKFAETARDLYFIYVFITFVLFLLLKVFGMSWLDSVTTSFSTMATGGFTCYNDNAGSFSMPVRIILILFMYLAGINFNLYYKCRKHGFRVFTRDTEFKFYTYIMLIGSALIFFCNLFYNVSDGAGETLVDSVFHVVSINTTTGFTSTDYDSWPTFSRLVLFTFFFIGGCASSTAGGIKVSRIIICLKLVKRSFSYRIHPNRVGNITMNREELSSDMIIRASNFVFMYIFAVFIGTLLISLNGLDFMSSLSCAASCLGNIGPGFGSVGPTFTYGVLNGFSKFVCILLMIAGRLELYSVIVLFSGYYWDPNKS